MKRIKLTNRTDAFCKIDDEDYDFISKFSWYAKASRHGWYACTGVRVHNRVITFRMHRLIMLCFSDGVVDHLDSNTFNNQQRNLETVTPAENTVRSNKPKYSDTVPF